GHQIIEEFMLAANEAVAETFAKAKRPMLYRIHEEPDSEKIADFRKFSHLLGLELPKETATPKWYNSVIDQVRGTSGEYVINMLLLRTMQQARYSPDNKGHFGLASLYYSHFTSPIRRYPDLIVHRLICDLHMDLEQDQKIYTIASPADSLKQAGTYLSERERIAVSSEREMADRLKCQYMSGRIGDSFRAVISGVSDTVFFVELLDVFVSGAVSLATLSDDYYLLDKKNHRLIGDVTGNLIQLGDHIEVILLDVEHDKNRISFTLKQTSRTALHEKIPDKHQMRPKL
ncbi:MAG: RNB domain-containing ribonuclease, partial [Deltaproteobacteria bacterium]|nr:RNB domain-containing ribonuclease [Deltaproteobacteria bacterium]